MPVNGPDISHKAGAQGQMVNVSIIKLKIIFTNSFNLKWIQVQPNSYNLQNFKQQYNYETDNLLKLPETRSGVI